MSETKPTRCGFAAIIGLPNAGKSTLINTVVGSKVSIVSSKVQTTRTRVLGIVIHDNAQIVLVDTPGIFAPKKTLEKAMVRAAWDAVPEADLIVHIVDATERNAAHKNRDIIQRLPAGAKCLLVLNKTDKVKKPDLLILTQALNDLHDYAATFMISALKKEGTDRLLNHLAVLLPEGPYMFGEDEITDMPMRMMAAEITREQIFRQLHEELPYSIMVHTEKWEEFDNGSIKIDQAIFVHKDTQKAIVLGKGGSRIKQIGETARLEMEELFEARVHLKLFVKVEENWSERAENYPLMGLNFSS